MNRIRFELSWWIIALALAIMPKCKVRMDMLISLKELILKTWPNVEPEGKNQ